MSEQINLSIRLDLGQRARACDLEDSVGNDIFATAAEIIFLRDDNKRLRDELTAMTLERDALRTGKRAEYAAMAIQGLCANPGGPFQANGQLGWSLCNCTTESIAQTAIDCADSLLKELAK